MPSPTNRAEEETIGAQHAILLATVSLDPFRLSKNGEREQREESKADRDCGWLVGKPSLIGKVRFARNTTGTGSQDRQPDLR